MKRVLVVDDSRCDRMIHRHWLEACRDEEFEIHEAERVEEALALALATRFDCVLMDYVLPGGDGLHGVRLLRAAVPDCPPIILLTCALTEDMSRNAVALGASESRTKPIRDGQLLVDAILRVIAEKESRVNELTGNT